ncbi:hypothetical protein A2W14_03785 [Candidatus Gottesmanbacteria bacterium RBG_16_37_8]|uniref:Purine nucleoside phosphorylase n=1 Tax=Candidatus Gottesmanbacteria bacterium RBG_16_37_8 TaxID=1798371 RepID=A0A1F5YSY6_9BACT|nr:MAG: hypothetical protein A2W14_03785 [Candidatus Gottesmanbacteria bacterium RBG_16_37_8]
MVQSKILKKQKSVKHFFLNRYEGKTGQFRKLIEMSFSCQQVHNNKIAFIGKKTYYSGVDGLITDKKAILTLRTADCLPIFIYCEDKGVIAALHAGWKGLMKGIIIESFKKLSLFRIKYNTVKVAIGPHIGVCCYEVGKDLIDKFSKKLAYGDFFYKEKEDKYYLDLSKVAISQLAEIGITKSKIDDVNICTSCSKSFFSYRRDHKNERNYSLLMIN